MAASLYACVLTYLVWSVAICLRRARLVRQNYATIGKRGLGWLAVFLAIQIAVWGSMAVGDIAFPGSSWDPLWAANCLLFFAMDLFGFQRPQFFEQLEGAMPAQAPADRSRYRNSALPRETLDRCVVRLNRVMVEGKPYLETDLSLARLADLAGLSPHNLSQVLNEGLGMSFYDFVIGFRIREAARREGGEGAAFQTWKAASLAIHIWAISTAVISIVLTLFLGGLSDAMAWTGQLEGECEVKY